MPKKRRKVGWSLSSPSQTELGVSSQRPLPLQPHPLEVCSDGLQQPLQRFLVTPQERTAFHGVHFLHQSVAFAAGEADYFQNRRPAGFVLPGHEFGFGLERGNLGDFESKHIAHRSSYHIFRCLGLLILLQEVPHSLVELPVIFEESGHHLQNQFILPEEDLKANKTEKIEQDGK